MGASPPTRSVKSPVWRVVIPIVNLPFVRLSYSVVYLLLVAFGRLFKYDLALMHPSQITSWADDKTRGFRVHTTDWNQKRVAETVDKVKEVRRYAQILRDRVNSDSELEAEKEALVQTIIAHLERNDQWTTISEFDRRQAECAKVLDDVEPSIRLRAMGLACETIRRKLNNVVLHDVQIQAALRLTDGYFIELRNGEGKTFVAVPVLTWAAIRVQALRRFAAAREIDPPFETCFGFTANDYLVRRDFVWLKSVYETMGIAVSYIQNDEHYEEAKRLAYTADLVLMEGTEYGFDYLRNSCREFGRKKIIQAPYYVLVDEVDQLLLDEARTPLILSGSAKVKASSFVEKAWVDQVDHWVENIFIENRFFQANTDSYHLTTGGRIYLRSIIAESNIETWPTFYNFVTQQEGSLWLAIFFTVLLRTEAFARQLMPSVAAAMESYLKRFGPPIERNSQGRWRFTRDGAKAFKLSITTEARPDLAEFNETLNFAMTQIQQFSAEDLQSIAGFRKRRVFSILSRMITSGSYLRKIITRAFDKVTAAAEGVELTADFQEGLEILARGGVVTTSNGGPSSLPHWLTFHAISGTAQLLAPAFRPTGNAETGIAADFEILVNLIKVISGLSNWKYSESPQAERLVEKFAIFGAIFQNFLFLPESGSLTATGRRVAWFLEEHCRQRKLTERYSEGGLVDLIEKSLLAYFGERKDHDYIIHNGKIVLVNQITGRPEPSKHFGRSLHPFVQAKHNLTIEEPTPTIRTITVQNLSKKIPRLAGMSGTLITEERELRELYADDETQPIVVGIPPRVEPDLKREATCLSTTKLKKWRAISKEILDVRKESEQPILVITSSVENSNSLHAVLEELVEEQGLTLAVNVLNAEYEEREEEIVAWAGQPNAVTIATQMAARGTDIVLSDVSIRLGGLYVIVAEFHETRRLDHQAQGRAARHGEPGRSRFYMSFEDPLAPEVIPQWFSGKFSRFFSLDEEDSFELQGTFAESANTGIRAAQAAKQYRDQKARHLYLNVDTVLDSYRDDAFSLREKFISGRANEIAEAIETLVDIYLDDVGLDQEYLPLVQVAREMAHDIMEGGLDSAALTRRYSERLAFSVSEASLNPIINAYAEQLTPTVDIGDQSASVQQLVYDALVTTARQADTELVNREWPRLADEFDLNNAFRPPHWRELLEYLDDNLVLGFDWADWHNAEIHLSNEMRRDVHSSAPPNVGEQMRRAITDAIALRGSQEGLADERHVGWADWPASSKHPKKIFGVDLATPDRKQVLADLKQAALDLLTPDNDRRERLCEEFLQVFDERWAQTLDDVSLLERRLQRREADASVSNSNLLTEIGALLRKTLTQLAHDTVQLLQRYNSLTSRSDSRFNVRRIPHGLFGPVWFLEPLTASETLEPPVEEMEETPAVYSFTPIEDSVSAGEETTRIEESSAAEETTEVNDEPVPDEKPTADEELEVVTNEESIESQLLRIFGPFDKRESVPSFRKAELDELLCNEFVDGNPDLWTAYAEELRANNHCLSAVAYLDLIQDNEKTARTRTLIFEALGCRENELEYLRVLHRVGRLGTRLRLRMTYLLLQGSPIEQGEAVRILLQDAVPKAPIPGRLEDLTPAQALSGALWQLLTAKEYDAMVTLFLEHSSVLGTATLDNYAIYELVAEALSKASASQKEVFAKAMATTWEEWLSDLFTTLYGSQDLRWIYAGRAGRALMRIALFSNNLQHVSRMLNELMTDQSDADSWYYLSSIFGSCGYEFEQKLFSARYAILEELYEKAIDDTEWLLKKGEDQEVLAYRVYALLSLARSLMDHRYSRETASKSLSESITLMQGMLSRDPESVPLELLLNALCLNGQFQEALSLIEQRNITQSSWRVYAALKQKLSQPTGVSSLASYLEEVAPVGGTEEFEACRVLNRWFEEMRRERPQQWRSPETLDALWALNNRWENLEVEESTYHLSWEYGVWLVLMADWLIDAERHKQAIDPLKVAAENWKRSLELTREEFPPYRSRLKRDERLMREVIEGALRRCLLSLKRLEKMDREISSPPN